MDEPCRMWPEVTVLTARAMAPLIRCIVLGLGVLACLAAQAMPQKERRELLDAIRPEAVRQAGGQAVRFKVDRLNRDGDWAMVIGSVEGVAGGPIDWHRATDCEPTLDKMLWVVARKDATRWSVVHLTICSPEPPYWYLEEYGGFVWPCGVYAGLHAGDGRDLAQQCRAARAALPREKR